MIGNVGLSQRDRRTLVLGVCIISLLVFGARGLPALRAWEANRLAEARTAAEQLARLRAGRSMLPELRASLRAARERLASLDSTLLSGANPPAIAARLASMLEDFADENAVRITALQLRSDSLTKGQLARVAVRLTGITDVAGLAGLLRAVEGDATPLVVEELSVSQGEPAAPETKPEMLRLDVLVGAIGLVRAEGRP